MDWESTDAVAYRHALRDWLLDSDAAEAAPNRDLSRPVLVVGCGTMGEQIATLARRQRLNVGLFDADPQRAERLAQSLASLGGLTVHRSIDQVKSMQYGLMIETIVEQVGAKQKLLAALESRLPRDCLFTTNTSTLSLELLAAGLTEPNRLLGMHFLLPVHERELIEIVVQPGNSTSDLEFARAWTRCLERLPLFVADQTGFLVNRLLFPVLNRAIELWLAGNSPLEIDRCALKLGLGFGPFLAMDHIGLDTVVRAGAGFWQKFPRRFRPSPLLPALVKRGRLGRKAESGIFDYRQVQPTDGRPAAQLEFLDQLARVEAGGVDVEVAQVWQQYCDRRQRHLSDAEMSDGLWTAALDEAIRVCDDHYVTDPRGVDAAWIFGLGLSERLGGPFYWALADRRLSRFDPSAWLPRDADAAEWKSRLRYWSNQTRILTETR